MNKSSKYSKRLKPGPYIYRGKNGLSMKLYSKFFSEIHYVSLGIFQFRKPHFTILSFSLPDEA